MTDRYAVMGNPVAHSQSPFIHTRFAEQTGQALEYHAIDVPRDGFAQALAKFQQEGGKGLNVTVPFKEEAWRLMDDCSGRAERAGAVNTIWFDPQGRRCGDNTDGIGLIRDLVGNLGFELRGRRVLVLGAGGAARGVLGPLHDEEPRALVIANRTPERARVLADLFGGTGVVEPCAFDGLRGRHFDLIINATSASLTGTVPRIPDDLLAEEGWCYDMAYAQGATAFVQWGEARGARGRSVDGLGMLVEQAAESFQRWRGIRPETASVIAELRSRLRSGAEKKT